ncbi:hypothetical protein OFR22_01015 [Brachyspira hyodysenteriae]|uniref:Tetratricopeptide repeat protein n=1 Tax=Brachyspira hyodysenteriae ATCC 27164 TaxID=1266923 RepID=A0A3B6VPR4_BRAHO|nr:hypothetical protein [Brachyspira hyodysenteriae]ANN62464.1 hypothetical protein BHYOB78_00915 [Brachyspira hyodysenteriae ATCC 27164]KLI17234.1 hypothetical protein SU44_04150 [Brachyspira hyodysenteriae]KLI21889.1 hypothetical protein SU46_01180 [Brachyspira hyodysenteriae]KLI28785.1 hypothetical protein SZ47_00535 [Brachyspira hyodysenteriae]KLI37890.1 hypothetical protein SZ53_13065 [Brachyspira hyodysenteriae]
MKKVIAFILLLYFPLFSQNSITFPDYIEDLQNKSPKKSIDWFKKNSYSDEYGVNEYVFDFYRGVSRYLSFVKFGSARTEVNRAASDFRKALELPNDPVYSYNDRAFLYLGGILTILPGDKELPARIFKYYADNCKTSNPNYPTAIYWSMYLSYITPMVYESYYETLNILSKNPNNKIYDYFTGENKTINEMMKKLKSPENMTQKVYEWTTSNMDVYTLITNSIPILPEEDGLSVFTAQKFDTFERYSPTKKIDEIEEEIEKDEDLVNTEIAPEEKEELDELQNIAKREKTPENVSNRRIPSIEKEIVDEIVIDDPKTIEYKTNILRGTKEQKDIPQPTNIETEIEDKPLYPLTILIDKNPNNGPIGVDIEDYSFNTEVSTNFVIEVSEGMYEAYISFGDKLYTNAVKVEKDKYNLFSIIIQDQTAPTNETVENIEPIEEDLLDNEEKKEDVSLTVGKENVPANKYDGNAENTRNIIRDVLSRPSKVATEWFNTNPYNEYMGISVEEYTYYRGVSYYSRFLNEGRKSSEFAAQAKSDLTFAYNKKDNSNLLMRTRLYLGAVNLFAYNDLYEADKMFAEVGASLAEDHRYYPTVLYWRSRIGVADTAKLDEFSKTLSSKAGNTQILDYSSTMFKDLSAMPSYEEKITGIRAVKNSKPIYDPPKSTSKAGSSKTQEVLN